MMTPLDAATKALQATWRKAGPATEDVDRTIALWIIDGLEPEEAWVSLGQRAPLRYGWSRVRQVMLRRK